MRFLSQNIRQVVMVLVLLIVAGCAKQEVTIATAKQRPPGSTTTFDVYKSPSCGCCEEWIEHIEREGFSTNIHHPDDLNQLKITKGIAPSYQSCHTAITQHGYVFEGHVPAKFIQQFLVSPPPNAIGLAVPGMPLGSPGMEMGDRFSSYQVLLLMADGSAKVFAEINSSQDQFD
ncbi:MAG: DUF411 domain-containing protein [Spongiibacteraceae bacterium]